MAKVPTFLLTDTGPNYTFRRASTLDLCTEDQDREVRRLISDQHIGDRTFGNRQHRIKHLPPEKARTEALSLVALGYGFDAFGYSRHGTVCGTPGSMSNAEAIQLNKRLRTLSLVIASAIENGFPCQCPRSRFYSHQEFSAPGSRCLQDCNDVLCDLALYQYPGEVAESCD